MHTNRARQQQSCLYLITILPANKQSPGLSHLSGCSWMFSEDQMVMATVMVMAL
jgi:hypothetical protein